MTSVKTNKKGFTLVELVVVIAILAILAAIAIPVVNSIINTASKNGALSNAQSIELAVKNAQANIASKNTEIYNGGTKTDAAGTAGVIIPNAKTNHGDINVYHVAVANGIEDAFDQVTYKGNNYFPYWDNNAGKCLFIGKVGSDDLTIDGEKAPTSGLKALTDTSSATAGKGKYHIADVKIDDIKTEAVLTTPGGGT